MLRIPDIRYVPNKHRFLMKLAEGRRVLHIGCADALAEVEHKAQEGRFLHARLAQTARELWGCDIDAKVLDRLRELFAMEHLVLADAQNLKLEDVGGRPFEMAIAAEVIEHLTNPGSLLESVRRILARGGLFSITTPNGACP